MQKYFPYIFGGVALVVVCITVIITTSLASGKPIYAQVNGVADSKNNISVSAIGKVTVTPDLATFYVGYTTTAKSLDSVQQELESKSIALVNALKQSGVREADIQTYDYRIESNVYWTKSGGQASNGHNGTLSIYVKVRDLKSVGRVIDNVLDAGANTVSNISFTVDDKAKYETMARIKATKAAKDKAQTLAQASDSSLGGLLYITESTYDPTPYYKGVYDLSSSQAESAPSIQGGSFEISVTVTATYAIN